MKNGEKKSRQCAYKILYSTSNYHMCTTGPVVLAYTTKKNKISRINRCLVNICNMHIKWLKYAFEMSREREVKIDKRPKTHAYNFKNFVRRKIGFILKFPLNIG